MNKKGFVNVILIAIIAVLVVSAGYFLLVKQDCRLQELDMYTCESYASHFINSFRKPISAYPAQIPDTSKNATTLPATCKDEEEGVPVITSLSSYSGSVGTSLKINGCNFAGFEGDKIAIIENKDSIIGVVGSDEGSTSKLIKTTLKSPLCQKDNSYSGLPCDATLMLNPGVYKIYASAWGKQSNKVYFTIK